MFGIGFIDLFWRKVRFGTGGLQIFLAATATKRYRRALVSHFTHLLMSDRAKRAIVVSADEKFLIVAGNFTLGKIV